MLYRTEHVKLHTLIHITTTSFHTLIHITSTSLTIKSCIPRNFKLHPDPHNHKYWDLQINRYSWIPQNMLFNMGRSPQRSSIHLQEQNGISSTCILQEDYNQHIYVQGHQESWWSKIKQQINQVNRPFGKKYTTRLEHEHRKVKMISMKLKLPMKVE